MLFEDAVKYIMDIPKFGIQTDGRHKTGEENLLYVMNKLGNPHKNKKIIHIAGTNGKGSTVQFVKDILCMCGYSVGCFTSPHLVHINERITSSKLSEDGKRIEDRNISNNEFIECFDLVKKAVDDSVSEGRVHLSFFEFLFAMSAVYYDINVVDYIVYETGLGGRLDATNIVEPLVTAITSIGLDHEKYLGNTIAAIAEEKAGIIKFNVPVVYNTGEAEADAVIKEVADSRCAKAINVANSEYIINDFTDKTIDFSLYTSYYRYENIKLNVGGALYQVDNAITAITICNCLFEKDGYISDDKIKAALRGFSWAGRMEMLGDNVLLDGAHNYDAIDRFIESINYEYPDKEIKLLFAVSGDKDYTLMIEALCNRLNLGEIYVTSLNSDRGISAEYIAALFRHCMNKKSDAPVKIYSDDSIKNTFNAGYKSAVKANDILFCVGSLYLIGSIKELVAEDIK